MIENIDNNTDSLSQPQEDDLDKLKIQQVSGVNPYVLPGGYQTLQQINAVKEQEKAAKAAKDDREAKRQEEFAAGRMLYNGEGYEDENALKGALMTEYSKDPLWRQAAKEQAYKDTKKWFGISDEQWNTLSDDMKDSLLIRGASDRSVTDPALARTIEQMTPVEVPQDIGNSVYDKKQYTIEELMNYNDVRARNQPWYSKVASGVVKMGITAATTFGEGTVGLVWGLGSSIYNRDISRMWDNDFINTMQDITDAAEEWFPNYYTQAELDREWYENMIDPSGMANFWADHILKNMGFTIGAAGAGMVTGGAIGAVGRTVQGVRTATQGAAQIAARTAAGSMKKPVSDVVSRTVGATIAAESEGAIEANTAAREWIEQENTKLDAFYQDKLKNLQKEFPEFFNNDGSLTYSAEQALKGDYTGNAPTGRPDNSELGQRQMPAMQNYRPERLNAFKARVDELRNAYENTQKKIKDDAKDVGNSVLAMNMPILLAEHMWVFGRLYASKTPVGNVSNIIRTGEEFGVGKAKARALAIAEGTGKVAYEGTQEGLQKAAVEISKAYYDPRVFDFFEEQLDPDAEKHAVSWLTAAQQGMVTTFTDVDTYEEVFAGALMGLVGLPGVHAEYRENEKGEVEKIWKVSWHGALADAKSDYNARTKKAAEIVSYINKRVGDKSKLATQWNSVVRHMALDEESAEAVRNGDESSEVAAEIKGIINDVIMFDEAGALNVLKEIVTEAGNISDQDLETMVRTTTSVNENGQLQGPFAQYAKKTQDGKIVANYTDSQKGEIREQLEKNRSVIENAIDVYAKSKEQVQSVAKLYNQVEDKDEASRDMLSSLLMWRVGSDLVGGHLQGKYKDEIQNAVQDHYDSYEKEGATREERALHKKEGQFLKDGNVGVFTADEMASILSESTEFAEKNDQGKWTLTEKGEDAARYLAMKKSYEKAFDKFLYDPGAYRREQQKLLKKRMKKEYERQETELANQLATIFGVRIDTPETDTGTEGGTSLTDTASNDASRASRQTGELWQKVDRAIDDFRTKAKGKISLAQQRQMIKGALDKLSKKVKGVEEYTKSRALIAELNGTKAEGETENAIIANVVNFLKAQDPSAVTRDYIKEQIQLYAQNEENMDAVAHIIEEYDKHSKLMSILKGIVSVRDTLNDLGENDLYTFLSAFKEQYEQILENAKANGGKSVRIFIIKGQDGSLSMNGVDLASHKIYKVQKDSNGETVISQRDFADEELNKLIKEDQDSVSYESYSSIDLLRDIERYLKSFPHADKTRCEEIKAWSYEVRKEVSAAKALYTRTTNAKGTKTKTAEEQKKDLSNIYIMKHANGENIDAVLEYVKRQQKEQQDKTDDEAYSNAKKTGTVDAFEEYKKEYSNGNHVQEADEEIKRLKGKDLNDADDKAFNDAQTANTVEAYQSYLTNHFSGKHVTDANNAIKRLNEDKKDDEDYEKARQALTVEAFNEYLKAHSGGKHASRANEAIGIINRQQSDNNDWQQAQQADDIDGYYKYLDSHPDGQHRGEASDKIHELKGQKQSIYMSAVPEVSNEDKQKGEYRPFWKMPNYSQAEPSWIFLNEKGAYTFVNTGQLKPGEQVYFGVDRRFANYDKINWQNTVFMYVKRDNSYQVIGVCYLNTQYNRRNHSETATIYAALEKAKDANGDVMFESGKNVKILDGVEAKVDFVTSAVMRVNKDKEVKDAKTALNNSVGAKADKIYVGITHYPSKDNPEDGVRITYGNDVLYMGDKTKVGQVSFVVQDSQGRFVPISIRTASFAKDSLRPGALKDEIDQLFKDIEGTPEERGRALVKLQDKDATPVYPSFGVGLTYSYSDDGKGNIVVKGKDSYGNEHNIDTVAYANFRGWVENNSFMLQIPESGATLADSKRAMQLLDEGYLSTDVYSFDLVGATFAIKDFTAAQQQPSRTAAPAVQQTGQASRGTGGIFVRKTKATKKLPKTRLATPSLLYRKMNLREELAWLERVLPQMTLGDRMKVVRGLISVRRNGPGAWGLFSNGVITLSDIAAEGTLYHEAFHAVFDEYLTDEEKEEIFEEARHTIAGGDAMTRMELEEAMAEQFREYVTLRQGERSLSDAEKNSPFLRRIGQKIKEFFGRIWSLMTGRNNKLLVRGDLERRFSSLESLYAAIDEGQFAVLDTEKKEGGRAKERIGEIFGAFSLTDDDLRRYYRGRHREHAPEPILDTLERLFSHEHGASFLSDAGVAVAFMMQNDPRAGDLLAACLEQSSDVLEETDETENTVTIKDKDGKTRRYGRDTVLDVLGRETTGELRRVYGLRAMTDSSDRMKSLAHGMLRGFTEKLSGMSAAAAAFAETLDAQSENTPKDKIIASLAKKGIYLTEDLSQSLQRGRKSQKKLVFEYLGSVSERAIRRELESVQDVELHARLAASTDVPSDMTNMNKTVHSFVSAPFDYEIRKDKRGRRFVYKDGTAIAQVTREGREVLPLTEEGNEVRMIDISTLDNKNKDLAEGETLFSEIYRNPDRKHTPGARVANSKTGTDYASSHRNMLLRGSLPMTYAQLEAADAPYTLRQRLDESLVIRATDAADEVSRLADEDDRFMSWRRELETERKDGETAREFHHRVWEQAKQKAAREGRQIIVDTAVGEEAYREDVSSAVSAPKTKTVTKKAGAALNEAVNDPSFILTVMRGQESMRNIRYGDVAELLERRGRGTARSESEVAEGVRAVIGLLSNDPGSIDERKLDQDVHEEMEKRKGAVTESRSLRSFMRETLGAASWSLLSEQEKTLFGSKEQFDDCPQSIKDNVIMCAAF